MKYISKCYGYIYPLICLLLLTGCSASEKISKIIHLSGSTMGTSYSVVVLNPKLRFDKTTLSIKIESVLKQVIDEMSSYKNDSNLSSFNQSKSTDWVDMPQGIIELVNTAALISAKTQGAYDITIAPVVNLWGFGPLPRDADKVPRSNQITAAMSQVGYQKLDSRDQPHSLKKDLQGLTIDLSSIAKGYAVDLIGKSFESIGIQDYLVEIGGELRTRGKSPRGGSWRIGIENPGLASEKTAVKQALHLSDSHIATSGDYRNYFEKDGVRYSHTIDARTGQPISHHLASVTVAHSSTADADGWATALMVLGETAGFDTAVKQDIAAYFVYREGEDYKVKYTPRFEELLE